MKKIFLLTFLSIFFTTKPIFEIFQRKARHPLNEPSETADLGQLLGRMPRIRTASQVAFLAIMAGYIRMSNKSYDATHFVLKDACTPINIVSDPLKCIDDGLIGHPGKGAQPAYGVLGTTWTWVPKIDKTLIAVDKAKRKTEAWANWLQKNLRSLDNQTFLERWWDQFKQLIR